MKKLKAILPALVLLVVTSCGNEDDTVVEDSDILEEVDQFYIKLIDNGETTSIEASSYTKAEHYQIARDSAYLKGDLAGIYASAIINSTSIYEIENIVGLRLDFSMSNFTDPNSRKHSFEVEISSSNAAELFCSSPDAIIDNLFQAENNEFHIDHLSSSSAENILKTDLDIALVNVNYTQFDPVTQRDVSYKSYSNMALSQPETSFFRITSVTEKEHRTSSIGEDVLLIGGYDYIIEGIGKVRLFNDNSQNPEIDFKDLDFTFKMPSVKLIPLSLGNSFNICD